MTTITAEKRWTERLERWVTPRDVFRPDGFAVDVLRDRDAKAFVTREHYSGTYPAARCAIGLFLEKSLVGVAVFSVPANARVLPHYFGEDVNAAELGRFVCAPCVGYNGESWFLARAFRALREVKQIVGVLSYADPLERTTADGEIAKRAHWGTIYQASNARYVGRAEPLTLLVTADGRVISPRALSKIRNDERGARYAAAQLEAFGAPARAFGEEPAAWVTRVSSGFRKIRHPGNLAYVFGLTPAIRTSIDVQWGAGQPYPKAKAA